MKFYKASQEERDVFWDFYEQVTWVGFKEPPCQCALVSPASTYLTTNKIPFQDAEVVYEYGTIFQLLVSKSKFRQGMENVNVDQPLIDGYLDYLFASKLLVPSID